MHFKTNQNEKKSFLYQLGYLFAGSSTI